MTVNKTQTVSISSGLLTLDDIEQFVKSARGAGAEGSETVSVHKYAGDRPWDSGTASLTVTIDGDKK